jgi:hypothetical protein
MSMQTPQPRADLDNVSIVYFRMQMVCYEHSPDHHGTTTDSLDVPNWGVGCECESSVQDTSKDTREKWRVVEVAEDLGREVHQHVNTKELLSLVTC